MRAKVLFFFIIFISLLPLPTKAWALASNWQRDGAVDARLISGLEGVGQKSTIPLGLDIKMEPGWHTYWRSPGVAGLPPQLDWSKSETEEGNLRQATLLYPAPTRYSDHDLETIGYQNHVIFPIDAELRQSGHALKIDTTLTMLACSSLCVPKTFTFKLVIPAETATEGEEADTLKPFRNLVPGEDEERAGLTLQKVTNTGSALRFDISGREPLVNPDIFLETDPETPFTAPDIKISTDKLSATLTVKPTDAKQELGTLIGSTLRVTLVDEKHALDAHVTVPSVDTSDMQSLGPMTISFALVLAILGGFILNLMPCVLPVLSLKILSVVGHGGGSPAAVRRSFLTSAAGILFSFLLLAAMTLVLKSFGMSLGWGVQFQQPLFLIFLILLLTLFATNMWGLFEVRLPHFIMKKLSDHHPKMLGDFASGALATLLATPCTAPFLGTAVGFALGTGTPRDVIAIFTALGFGMTLPYLAIAAIPELATSLPKPGVWMLRLRVVLGFALALTTVWLLWVLSAHISSRLAIDIGICLLAMIALLGLSHFGFVQKILQPGLGILVAMTVLLVLIGSPHRDTQTQNDAKWLPFTPASIATQVAAGHVVFVDITADWCLTCKANKQFALSDDDINQRLFHSDIIAMQGDWTASDPAITSFLQSFRRFGIPFDVVYGPGAPQGITLPELLTHDTVIDALNKAEKPR